MNENITGLIEALQQFTLTPAAIAGGVLGAVVILSAILIVRWALTGGR